MPTRPNTTPTGGSASGVDIPPPPYWSFEDDRLMDEYREAHKKLIEDAGYGELSGKVAELRKAITKKNQEKEGLEKLIAKDEEKASGFFTRKKTKDALNAKIGENRTALNVINGELAELSMQLKDAEEAVKEQQDQRAEDEKNVKELAKKLLAGRGVPESLRREVKQDLEEAEKVSKKLEEERNKLDEVIKDAEGKMPSRFQAIFSSNKRATRKAYKETLEKLRKERAKISKDYASAEADKNAKKERKEKQEKDINQKEADKKLTELYKAMQEAKKAVEDNGGERKAPRKLIRVAKEKEEEYRKALETNDGFLRRVDLGEFDKEVFEDAKNRAEKEAKEKEEEFNLRLRDAVFRGEKGFKNSKEYKDAVQKCISTSKTIINVMQDLKKDFPEGFPLPNELISVKRKNTVVKNGKLVTPGGLFGTTGKINTFQLNYETIIERLDKIFGENGCMKMLMNSPFTDKNSNHKGYAYIADGAMRLFKQLQFNKVKNLFENTKKFVGEVSVGEEAEEVSPEEKKRADEVEVALQGLVKAMNSSMDDVKIELKRKKGTAFADAEEQLEENKKIVDAEIKKLNDTLRGNNSLNGKMKKLGEGIGIANTVLGCIKLPLLKDVAATASKVINAPFTIAKKLINIFEVERAYGPEFKAAQQKLTSAYDKLAKAYDEAIDLYNSASMDLLKKKNKEEDAAYPEQTLLDYARLIEDWENIRDDFTTFSIECIKLGNEYKPFGIHVHEYKKLLQKAKWETILFMRRGVFKTTGDVGYLATVKKEAMRLYKAAK